MKNKAFTLIEILVTIMVLAILVVLCLPAIQTTMSKSRTIKCVSNKRQITAAYLLWINDSNNGMLWECPTYTGFNSRGSPLIGDQKSKAQTGYFTTMLIPYGLEQATWTGWSSPIKNRSKTVWYCPTTYKDSAAASWGSTYFFCNLGVELNGIPRISLAALGTAASQKPYLWDYLGNHRDEKKRWPDSGHNIYAYLDGHVEVK